MRTILSFIICTVTGVALVYMCSSVFVAWLLS